jgi:hypothetical protein
MAYENHFNGKIICQYFFSDLKGNDISEKLAHTLNQAILYFQQT